MCMRAKGGAWVGFREEEGAARAEMEDPRERRALDKREGAAAKGGGGTESEGGGAQRSRALAESPVTRLSGERGWVPRAWG